MNFHLGISKDNLRIVGRSPTWSCHRKGGLRHFGHSNKPFFWSILRLLHNNWGYVSVADWFGVNIETLNALLRIAAKWVAALLYVLPKGWNVSVLQLRATPLSVFLQQSFSIQHQQMLRVWLMSLSDINKTYINVERLMLLTQSTNKELRWTMKKLFLPVSLLTGFRGEREPSESDVFSFFPCSECQVVR